ncbi:MAG: hypothetical protein KDC53_15255 [Saprospiraceae bacterium]|nr:hypothetical protein [Saprospiraceae bacterium]
MKYYRIMTILWFCICLAIMASAQSTFTLRPADQSLSKSELQYAGEIIEQRLSAAQVELLTIETHPNDLKVVLRSEISPEYLKLLLTTRGDIQFRPALDRDAFEQIISGYEAISALVDSLERVAPESSTDDYLLEMETKQSAHILKRVNQMMSKPLAGQLEIVEDLPDASGKIRLYGLPKTDTMQLGREDIADIRMEQTSGGDRIWIDLSEVGAKKFATMSEQQLHKTIAVIIDDLVIMAPRVHEVMTGDKVQITGLWQEGGDRVLYAILSTDILPAVFKVQ